MYLIAKADGGDLIQQAADNATSIAEGFNDLWNKTLEGGLYKILCDIGVLFAVATLTFFMFEWTKKMLDGDEHRPITDLIWPLIVVLFLTNNGKVLGQSTLGVRNYINNINNSVLKYAAAETNLRTGYQKAIGLESARKAIGTEIEKCRSSNLLPQEAVSCLEAAKKTLTNDYPDYFNKNNGTFGWFIDAIDNIIQAPIDAIKDGKSSLEILFSSTNAFIGSSLTDIISIVLLGLNGSYQWTIELTMLTTALIGPIAVGGSLLPYGTKSIFAWLIGYFSVGMAKLCFNIIVGFAGQLIADSKTYQPMFFLFTVGIMAPMLATGLAAGGGLAVFQQINKAFESYTSIAIDAGKAIATKGGSLVSKLGK